MANASWCADLRAICCASLAVVAVSSIDIPLTPKTGFKQADSALAGLFKAKQTNKNVLMIRITK